MTHDEFGEIEPPVSVTTEVPAVAVSVPPQLFVGAVGAGTGDAAMSRLADGKLSVIATPVSAVLVGLTSVNVNTEKFAGPLGIVDGLNDFVTVGDASTVSVPVAPVPAVGV